MNLLTDCPPERVKIGGAEYPIRSDFRVSVLFELLMLDEDITPEDRLIRTFDLYFPPENAPRHENPADIMRAVTWFYLCGRSDKEQRLRDALRDKNDDEEDSPEDEQRRIYSFDYDDEYIYAAFRQQYGIDLVAVDYLHWWEFRAMFKALDDRCQFVKIMGYRAAKITGKMSETERTFLNRMKRLYALPLSESERRRQDRLLDALKNGGDLSGLFGNGDADNDDE